ncbi:hypothetical protein VNO78_05426 [Psophocarpus tetragonolobus]|uniref:Uncharacterized protein n=1 Tax=Psophocarpus tetragonolobus TaxID=3891 RepID=A0AAN9SZG8_PSOTE
MSLMQMSFAVKVNPGRKFQECGRYDGISSHRDYFSGVDPPTTSQARRGNNGIITELNEMVEELMAAQKKTLLILPQKVETQKEDSMVLKRELVQFKDHIKKLRIAIGCMVIVMADVIVGLKSLVALMQSVIILLQLFGLPMNTTILEPDSHLSWL